ncbi:MAG: arginine--tRNA ligase [Clostridiales bacterium]|nr:MAG: arginine--tRNA ligase [Clostridiales bacterium]
MNEKNMAAACLSELLNGFSTADIFDMLEYPADRKLGDIALPCFKLSKAMRMPPQKIAESLCAGLKANEECANVFEKIENVNGYLNFYISNDYLLKNLNGMSDPDYGSSDVGKGKTIVIDYSSPNIAKPFHIGHLRSTVIGQSIKNIHRFCGYECVGVNHLGDWGTQFGKLIVAYKKWGDKETIEQRGIKALTEIYVRFHEEAEKDPSLEDEAREAFSKMEQGDSECIELWKWFVEISIAEFKKVYELIGADFESWNGESFYFDKTDEVVNALKEKNLLKLDNGAYIVSLDEYDMPPCLVLKSDGSTIYATRDIAAAFYRKKTYNFDKCIYVTSAGQSLHFAQFFKVIELMGEEWAKDLVHVPFGTVSIDGAKLATRTGNVILLEDLFREATEKTLEIINEKNPTLENKEEVASAVGVGAVIFHDLSNNRIKDINFIWDEVLNFDGNTGPYVQYTYARCCSILEKAGSYGKDGVITHPSEVDIIKTLSLFPEKVEQARRDLEPSVISRYLLDVCQEFNRFYHDCPVLRAEDEKVRSTRLAIVEATSVVLSNGLKLIGLKRPKNI